MSDINQDNLYIITGVGKDVTGLVAMLTSVIYDLNCNIVDISENVAHGFFSIFLIVDISNIKTNFNDFSKRLFEVGHQTGLKILLEKFQEGRRRTEKKMMLIVLIGKDKPGIVANTAIIFGDYGINIEHIKMLARGDLFLMEMFADISDITVNIDLAKSRLKTRLQELEVGVLFQTENIFIRKKKLIVFDLNCSMLKFDFTELLKYIEFDNSVKELNCIKTNLTKIKKCAEYLKEAKMEIVNKIFEKISLTADTEEIIRELKNFGYKICLISNGFNIFTEKIKQLLNIDYAFSNKLIIDTNTNTITGEIDEPIIDENKKKDIVKLIMQIENLNEDDVVLIGGILMKESGLSVTIENKFIIKLCRNNEITPKNLAGILCSI